MRLPPCPPSQGNCSRQGETRCRPRSFFPPRSARETEEMEKWSFQRTRELMTPRALRGIAVNEIGRARISMMVRSMSSNSRPDTLVQDRTPQPHRFLLQRTAGSIQKSDVRLALLPITTKQRTSHHVGDGPLRDMAHVFQTASELPHLPRPQGREARSNLRQVGGPVGQLKDPLLQPPEKTSAVARNSVPSGSCAMPGTSSILR